MSDIISVKYDREEIAKKTPDEKLNLLIEIAFANNALVADHHKTLFGNGEEGLCDTVRTQKKALRFLFSIVLLAGGGLISMLFMHISGK